MLNKPIVFSIPPKTHAQLLMEDVAGASPMSEREAKLFIEAAQQISPENGLDKALGFCIWHAIAKLGLHDKPLSHAEIQRLRELLADELIKTDYLETSKFRAETRLNFSFANTPLYREVMNAADCEKIRDLERAVGVICLAWQIVKEPGTLGIFASRRISFTDLEDLG